MNVRSGATQEEMRRRNLSNVLTEVHVHGAMSRAELTNLMGLNRSTIKALVAELDEARLVSEQIPDTRLGAGRPSHVVVPRGDSAYVVAANVAIDEVSLATVGLGGSVLERRSYRWNGHRSKPEVVAGRLAAEFAKLQAGAPRGSWPVGAGVGLPGTVRRTDGFVELAPNLQWRGVPFGQMLSRRLGAGLPLRVGNDGDLGALAEHIRGAGRGVDNMIYLQSEVGLGGGLVVDGRMLQGAGGVAGEIGHIKIRTDGRACRCGSVGCLETEVGEEALLRAAGRPTDGGRPAVLDVMARARAGDPAAVAAVREVASWLGRGVAVLANIFNPEMVILGGPLGGILALAEDVLTRRLDDDVLAAARQQLRLCVPGLAAESSLLGAAELAFEALLHDPVEALADRGAPVRGPDPSAPRRLGSRSRRDEGVPDGPARDDPRTA